MLFGFLIVSCSAKTQEISIEKSDNGSRLIVNGDYFIINGINWDYIPIEKNPITANFWTKPEDVIKAGLDNEMTLLKDMGVNTIRLYTGVPSKWIAYIYEHYGIYTMLNHSFGRYGLEINGEWNPLTIYENPEASQQLLNEVETLVKSYKDTPGLLLYLLGNENNYGLFWQGSETEDFPDDEERINSIGEHRGRPMYRLMNDAAKLIKSIDKLHPVAICNGDLMFADIISEECKDVDILGINVYRGLSFGDMFNEAKEKVDKPVLLTEFGSDAFDAIKNEENQKEQAKYNLQNWKEIYANAAGLGKAENAIGGFTFQFSDGWWKYSFDKRERADVHDSIATWSNGGYKFDFIEGQNNMNEEWFGICAKGPVDPCGLYPLYPRASYFALKKAHQLKPYSQNIKAESINDFFEGINLQEALLQAQEYKFDSIKRVKHYKEVCAKLQKAQN